MPYVTSRQAAKKAAKKAAEAKRRTSPGGTVRTARASMTPGSRSGGPRKKPGVPPLLPDDDEEVRYEYCRREGSSNDWGVDMGCESIHLT